MKWQAGKCYKTRGGYKAEIYKVTDHYIHGYVCSRLVKWTEGDGLRVSRMVSRYLVSNRN